jgi:3-oxoacyl-[acyl-carrier protein] reductase
MGYLYGRVALITGSGSGIGRATALLMAERGADIIVHDINAEGLADTVAGVRSHGREAHAIIADVTKRDAMFTAIAEAEKRFGKIDILVNNAGIAADRRPLEEVPEDYLDRQLAIHVKGSFFCIQAVIPGMKRRKYGKIVNMSSVNGTGGMANCNAYNAAKGALLSLTKGLAKEFAPWRICINAVAPGEIQTPMNIHLDSVEAIEANARSVPFGRYGHATEIAFAVTYLCSPEADFVTGQVVSPNGGAFIL